MGGGALENMFACLFVFPAHCTNFVFFFFRVIWECGVVFEGK